MAKFPEPPFAAELARIEPAIHDLAAGTELWRIYFRATAYPSAWDTLRAFGPVATARFDHHRPPPRIQDRGIMYAAVSGVTCLAEVFQYTRLIDRERGEPWLVGFAIELQVTLLDLTGPWPTRAGASMALSSGPRPRARRWSQTIYDAYPFAAGLWYPSSMHANQPAVALYERARPAVPPSPFFHRPLADRSLLRPLQHAADSLGYALV